jgi:hypothetical protein
MPKTKITTEVFIQRSKEKYGERYNYSKSEYINSSANITIICNLHGEFNINTREHMRGRKACVECIVYEREKRFIEQSKIVHNNKYDYSKVKYVNNSEKVVVICPDHGEFHILPAKHKNRKQGCQQCLGYIRDTKDFIQKAMECHGNKYDYSRSSYVNSTTKINIICPEHGSFQQAPGSHYSGNGCPKCVGLYSYTTDEWIEKAKSIHNNKYNYSKTEYINNRTYVKIICPEHGEFKQLPIAHTAQKCGCPKCGNKRGGLPRVTLKEFKERSKKIHNNKYDYKLIINLNRTQDIVEIICPKCGVFKQVASWHLSGNGCNTCRQLTTQEFISKSKIIHGDKYSYKKVEYVKNSEPVIITCPQHGEFLQKPRHHVNEKCGCPRCQSSKGEEAIRLWLERNKINYKTEHSFPNCKDKISLRFDFFIPKLNLCIEYDGEQHFRPTKRFGGNAAFISSQRRDKIKNGYCKKNKIKLLRVPYTEFQNIEKILSNEFIDHKV